MDYRKLNYILILLVLVSCGQFKHKHDSSKKEIIETDQAPKAIASYSQGIKVGNRIYVSGQIGLVPSTGKLVEGIESQTYQSMKNVEAVLNAADFSMDNVVQCQIYLANIAHYGRANEIYKKFFKTHLPARAVVAVSKIPLDALIEILVVAEK